MRTRNVLAAALAALCFSATASADEDMKMDGLYVKADLGAAFVQDISEDLGVAGLSATVGFDTGLMGAIGIGKHMGNSFRIEGEIGYINADAGDLTVSGSGGSVPLDFSGELSTLNFTLAGYVDLSDGQFRPYFGGGLGAARWETKITSIAGFDLNAEEDGTDLTAFAEAGVAYHVSDNLALTGSWRYQMASRFSSANANSSDAASPSLRRVGSLSGTTCATARPANGAFGELEAAYKVSNSGLLNTSANTSSKRMSRRRPRAAKYQRLSPNSSTTAE